jgi:nickel-type superoxide dismutase maturation protease
MGTGFLTVPLRLRCIQGGPGALVSIANRGGGRRPGTPVRGNPPGGRVTGRVRWPLWRVAVAERSMDPALRPGDWLLVRRGARPGRPPRLRPGQIVIARHPGEPGLLLVKRAARRERGGWWLESDNPGAGAVDSRRFGAVPASLIEGRVLLRYWPPRHGPAAPR